MSIPPACHNLCFIVATVVSDCSQQAMVPSGTYGVLRLDVDVIEQMLPHEPDVTLHVIGLHRIVFVKVECHDVRERQTFFLVHAHQFSIDARRRRAGRQSQYGRLPLSTTASDQRRNFRRDISRGLTGIFQNRTSQLLKLTQVLPLVHGSCNFRVLVVVPGFQVGTVNSNGCRGLFMRPAVRFEKRVCNRTSGSPRGFTTPLRYENADFSSHKGPASP
jgi:hypothetical protein